MERLKIEARPRMQTGKEYAKKIRRSGLLPAVIYKRAAAMSLELKEADLLKMIHQAHSENAVLDIEVVSEEGKKKIKTAILKDVSYDPVRGGIMHADFQEISLEEIVRVKVAIDIRGEAVGVKEDDGRLEHVLWELEVECKAGEIPESILVDVSNLKIGDAIHVSDLELPSEVKVITPAEQLVAHVIAPKVEVVEEEAVEEEEEAKEPEVIREKKEEQPPESEEE